MGNCMAKKLVLLFVLFFSCLLRAQTIYWVGGSGYWNDMNHWSYTSGGSPAGVLPGAGSDVVFDNASAQSDIVIHMLQGTVIGNLSSSNTNFRVNITGSPNVDLTLNGGVDLNEYFTLSLNGKIILTPHGQVKYNFSQNKFANEIDLTATQLVEMGTINSSGTILMRGNFTLKNSIILTKNLDISNASVKFDNTTIQARNAVASQGAVVTANTASTNRLITDKTKLSGQQLTQLGNVSGLALGSIAPQSCVVTLTSSTNPTCFGNCDGKAVFNLSGCTNPPYIIQWLNADPSTPCQQLPPAELSYTAATYSVNTLCGCGTQYSVLFENALGEQFAVQVSIVNPSATLLTFTSVQPSCNGLCNGMVKVNVVSGVVPLTLTWNPTATTHSNVVTKDTLKNACAATYTLTATNPNGCVNTFTTVLTQPMPLLPNGSATNINCGGTCTGSATVTPSGGTTPYGTTIWSNGQTGNTASAICAGVITATVSDSKGCTATYSANITQPPIITVTVNQTNLSCATSCNGSATVTTSGGVPPYTYNWSAPAVSTTSVASSLCIGTYTVNVKDALNCVKTVTLTITAPPPLVTTPTGTNVACNGVCIGAINVNPSGGTPTYTYNWSPSVSTGSTAVNLCAGVYSYTITDILGCQVSQSYTITQPPTISLTMSKTDVTCNGACNGTASVTVTGGVSPFTYTWSPGSPVGQGTSAISGLCPGTYVVNTKDNNNCPNSASVVITQPPPITPNVSSVIPTCNGVCNGSINSSPTGGTPPYTYTLQTSGAPIVGAPPFTGLCAGNYTLMIKDSHGCIKTQTLVLTQPNTITLSLSATPINCSGQCNSTISTIVNGGTPLYTISWSTGAVSPSLVNQCTGVYTATVTDAGGCTATASVNVTSPPAMTVAITPTGVTCSGSCNGSAFASVTGGTPNYSYSWTPTGSLTSNVSGLCVGNYTVTVKDNFGCIKTQTTTIQTPPALTLTPVNGTVSCAGSCNGSVGVVVTGGTGAYVYSWNTVPSQNTQNTTNSLCPGNYVVTVTDANGCIGSQSANVSQPPVLTVAISNVQSSCNICIGSATANGSGGTPPYSYSWVNSVGVVTNTTQVANNMCVGNYTLTITDSKGCTATQTVNIGQTVLVVVTSNGNTLQCNGACTGIAVANASGGTGSYSYTWTPAPVQNTQTATGLCAGNHTVVVQDALGCSNTGTVSFANPPAITVTVNQANATCNSSCNGSITATATGGTGALSYQWLPGGQTTPNITNLCAGTYTLNVTDANGCTATKMVTITEPSVVTATFNAVNPTTCISNDGSITITPGGGVGPYTFTWTPGGSVNPLTNLPAGTYSVIVKDANGCQQTIITTLSNPTGPTVTVTSNSVTCFGQCTGTSTVSAAGAGPFTYNWSGGAAPTASVNTGLCAGNYAVQVKDNNSCVTSQTLSIAQPPALSVVGNATNVTCNGACTGAVNLSPTGGVIPYSYTWTPAGGNAQNPSGLCANNYTVNMSDANGCPATATFVVTQPSTITLTFNKKDVLCNGGCTGGARVLVSGGTGPYTYSWTPVGAFGGSSVDSIINLCSGTYSVVVKDAMNCSVTGTVNIGQPTVLTSTITSMNVKCNGQCNGKATLTSAGGTSPYTYSWNSPPPNNTQTVTNLCQGSYIGTVTDANGCTSSQPFTITQPAPIVVTTTPSNPKCNSVCNGSVSTSVSGGTPAYTYQWIPAGGTVQNPTGLCAGIYTVTVKDDSLCTGQSVVTLTNPASLLANASFTNPTCSGGCNGAATASPVGGTAPYSYSWMSPLQTTQTINALCAGNYTVTVTDANACQSTQTITLSPPTALSVNPAITPASCGASNGSINAVVVTGNPPYSYQWLPPVPAAQATNSMVTGLSAGVYTVVVSDASACSATVTIPVSNSNGPSGATLTSTNVVCNGQCNGAASISNPVGGTPAYTIAWVNPVSTNTLITGLCPGSYTAQITDANNCILYMPVVITQPQVINDNSMLTSSACFGNCNGSIALNPTGGNGGYTYNWNNGASTSNITGLCPGNYSVTITDALNCTFTGTYNLPSLVTITSNTFAINNNCFGNCNGTLMATNVAGGLPPYTYSWSDPLGQTTPQAISLCNGSYSVTITDANGCYDILPGLITSPTNIVPNPSVTGPSCGLCNGTATLAPSGGNGGAYTVVWSNTNTGNTASNLCSGVYGVQITDNSGCVTNTNVVVNSSSGITGESVSKADESCFAACNGSITVTAIGGTAPISYHWVNNNATTPSITGLCSGTYYCNMTDANGCTRTATVTIGSAATLTITPTVKQTNCNSNTGSISVIVSGGTPAYTYSWLPAGNTATITNLVAGTYTLTATDANGCSKTQVFAINSINGPDVTVTKNDIHCSNACTGTASVSITGGAAPYTISWFNGASTPSIGGLCAGVYSVSVVDNAGCKGVQTFSISDTGPIVFSAPNVNAPKCHNDCNGAITAIPSGGSLPFTYSWTPTGSTPGLSNLCAGIYSITITDSQGCMASQSYTLNNPAPLSLSAAVTSPSCSATSNGSINITVTGGTPAYTYSWTGAITASAQNLNGIHVGTYSLQVVDAGGCIKDTTIVLTSTLNVDAVAGHDTSFCQGGSFTLNGSNSIGGVTYQWVQLPGNTVVSNASTATVTPAAGTSTYVLIANASGCTDSDTIHVTSHTPPFANAGPFVSIPLFTSTVIGGSPTGPNGCTFSWIPAFGLDNTNSANPTASNTITTQYTVTVKDAFGCTNSDTVTVFIYPQIKIPNGFTPNGDGKNDSWVIDNIQQFPDCVVEVYNRWGEQLFYSKGYGVPWDGHYKGKDLPVGTYYYVINLHHPSYPDAYTGPLTIFR